MKVGFVLANYFGNSKGGFEYQAESALQALDKNSSDCFEYFRYDSVEEYDILHFWGVENISSPILDRSQNSKIVFSLLLSYFEKNLSIYKWWPKMLFYHGWMFVRNAAKIDVITVVNSEQAAIAKKLFRWFKADIVVIPNIVRENFFSLTRRLECEDYFICLGNISRRKNQLSLLRVANEAGIPIVFVGALTNDEDSLQFQAEIKHSNCCKYIGHVDNCSTKMTSIVSSSRGLILMSESETQPIAVLEFLVASKPVILRNRAYVEQFRRLGNCIIVNELNRDSLVKAIESISSTILQENAHILREFKADSVGQQYLNIYRGCFS